MTEKEKLIKHHLAVLISRRQRIIPDGPECPTEWRFGEVIDPRSGKVFTEPGAWDFIVEKLKERGSKIKEKILDKPPGKKAYVLHVPTTNGVIYIKIHFGIDNPSVVYGRSFHYNEKG